MRQTITESPRLSLLLASCAGKPREEVAAMIRRTVPELGEWGAKAVAAQLDKVVEIRREGETAAEGWRRQVAAWTAGVDVPAAGQNRIESWSGSDHSEAVLVYIRKGRRLIHNLLAGRTLDDDGPHKPRRNEVVADIMAMCGVSRSTAHRALRRAAADPGCMRRSVAAEVGGSHECTPECPAPPRRFRATELLRDGHRERMQQQAENRAAEKVLQAGGRSREAARRWRQRYPDRDPATAPPARRPRS